MIKKGERVKAIENIENGIKKGFTGTAYRDCNKSLAFIAWDNYKGGHDGDSAIHRHQCWNVSLHKVQKIQDDWDE